MRDTIRFLVAAAAYLVFVVGIPFWLALKAAYGKFFTRKQK